MSRTQAVGWWLVGIIGMSIIAALLATFTWSGIRTGTEKMEGGWTRTAIDQNLEWAPYFFAFLVILTILWTLGVIAYHLVQQDIKSKPKEAV